MTNRVLLSTGIFKVSAPGYDVLTTTAPQNLLIDNTNSTMGTLATGQINAASQGMQQMEGGAYVNIPFVNPMGYLPFAFVQQQISSVTALGSNYYQNTTITKEYMDTTPPTTFTHTQYGDGSLYADIQLNQLKVWLGKNTGWTSYPIRYAIFWPQASTNAYAAGDYTPSPTPTWSNTFSAGSSSVTTYTQVTGINVAVTLQVISSLTPNANTTISGLISASGGGNYTEFDIPTGSNSMYLSVNPNDSLAFGISEAVANANTSTTLSVYNVTVGNTFLDSVTLGCYYTINYPTSVIPWNNVSTTAVDGATNAGSVDGMTVTSVSASLNFNPKYGGQVGINNNNYNVSTNNFNKNAPFYSCTFSVPFNLFNNSSVHLGASEVFYFYPWASYTGTVTVYDNTSGQSITSFNLSVTGTASDTIAALNFGSINSGNGGSSQSTSQTGTTSTNQIGPITTTHTLLLSALTSTGAAQTCSSSTIYYQVYKNGSLVATLNSGSSVSFTVVAYDQLYISATEFATYAVTYTGYVKLTDSSKSGALLANVSVTLDNSTSGGGSCCWTEAILPSGIKIKDVEVNDEVLLLTPNGDGYYKHHVDHISDLVLQPCGTIKTESGIELTCSYSTPIMYRIDPNETAIYAQDFLDSYIVGTYLPVLDAGDFKWEKIISIEDKGNLPVRLLSCGDNIYAAGDASGRYIFTHNTIKAIRLKDASLKAWPRGRLAINRDIKREV